MGALVTDTTEKPKRFAPLAAWSWRGQVYESDSSGLALHRADCVVGCCSDDDNDCTCGAHELNGLINAGDWTTY